ncbi:hypothetical protein E1202_23015 [Saccharopolyspora karakumensis]|uniref:HTH-type transcriptional repressor KstR2 C-terminal domain-containing protein n=1 Tax=Saccharopolyspora karakumensis TaxID=2530386 RepID=A0A4R5BGI1_9PSEU|nr:hypothetical protein [Saccharopolyspora karakumensis]TDD84559.1 hypothetical protein E1202_23015 [Saccharopolyspora karakumensis]
MVKTGEVLGFHLEQPVLGAHQQNRLEDELQPFGLPILEGRREKLVQEACPRAAASSPSPNARPATSSTWSPRWRRVEYRVGQHERTPLTPERLAEIDGYLQHYNQRVKDVLAAGMRSGEFRTMNPKLAALGILDMLNGVSNWIRGTADEVADTYVHLLLDGLSPGPADSRGA